MNCWAKLYQKINNFGDRLVFHCTSGEVYEMFHQQDCCESVYIEDINGDLQDLIGNPILIADESINCDNPLTYNCESWTWTFYKFATVKGYVDIRWYGSSNGYYSERVGFDRIE